MKTDSKPQELPTTAEIVMQLRNRARYWRADPQIHDVLKVAADRLEAADDVFVLITKSNERLTKRLEAAEIENHKKHLKMLKAEATIKSFGEVKSRTFKSLNGIPVGLPENELWVKKSDIDALLENHNG